MFVIVIHQILLFMNSRIEFDFEAKPSIMSYSLLYFQLQSIDAEYFVNPECCTSKFFWAQSKVVLSLAKHSQCSRCQDHSRSATFSIRQCLFLLIQLFLNWSLFLPLIPSDLLITSYSALATLLS